MIHKPSGQTYNVDTQIINAHEFETKLHTQLSHAKSELTSTPYVYVHPNGLSNDGHDIQPKAEHYLRLPGFNVYISGDLRSPPPSRKKVF